MAISSRGRVAALGALIALALSACGGGSPQYQAYRDACGWLGATSTCDQYDEGSVQSFMEGNCLNVKETDRVSFAVQGEDGLRHAAAAFWGYCRDGLEPMLGAVSTQEPELATTAQTILSTLEVHK